MTRLLFVVPRFGADVVGGAETLLRGLATRAPEPADEVTVATTCAVDHTTWANELQAGARDEDGVRVLRFRVGRRDADRHGRLHARLQGDGRLSYLRELELMGAGVWSPELQRHLEVHGRGYDLIIFSPYLFGTTFWGVQAHPDRSVLLPCLHDEPDAHMRCLRAPFGAAAGWIFNTPAEERLARRLFAVRDGGVVGMGFDPPAAPPRPGFSRSRGLGRYILYAGRLEQGKRVDVAVEYAARFIAERDPQLRLVLVGRGSYRVPRRHRDRVVELGYLDEDEKRSAYAEALAVVNPSEMESLSLVLLEGWLEGTPALVAGGSEVMREHCERSGGGITFDDYPSFAGGLARMLGDDDERRRMGERGRDYVLGEYGWPAVAGRFRTLVERLRA